MSFPNTIPVRKTEESKEEEKKDKKPEPKKVSPTEKKTSQREETGAEPKKEEKIIQPEVPLQKTDSVSKAVKEPKITPKAELPAAEPEAEKKEKPERETVISEKKKKEMSVSGSVNLQIQKMHKEGKSVLEISKALNIGQGEVKLVIALYGDRKG